MGHRANIKYEIIDVISYILSDYSKIKVEISSKRNGPNIWRVSNPLLSERVGH